MAFSAGYRGHISIDNASGTPVTLSTYVDTLSVTQSNETIDVSTLGTISKEYLAGMADGTLSFSGPFDSVIGTHISGCRAAQAAGTASFSFEWGPGGTAAGQAKVTGECIITAYDLNTSASGRADYSASMQITGAVTNDTY